MAKVLETTTGYLIGETQNRELLKDSAMQKRLNNISKFSKEDKEHILYTLDAMINNVKPKQIKTERTPRNLENPRGCMISIR